MFLKILRIVSRFIVHVIARVEIVGMDNIPANGGAVVVANHIGRLDAMLGVVLSSRTDFVLFVADKYRTSAFWRFFVRHLDAVWLNREGLDLKAMRAVQQRLEAGQVLLIAPEGTRSSSGTMQPAKPGAAYLAARAGLPVVPIGITGTEDHLVRGRLRRLQRLDIRINIGEPFYLAPLERHTRDAQLAAYTDEIMCQIGRLLPPQYRGIYASHPRLDELLAAT